MNWKSEAVDKLRQYKAKKLSLVNIPLEISRLESAARGVRSAASDGTLVSGGGSSREDMLLSNIVHREELERSLEQAQKWVALVDAALAILSAEERLLLERFYVHPARGNVDKLCDELGLEKSQVYAKKDSAIRHFTISLYGCCET